MATITSKRHILKFYVALAVTTFMFLVMGLFLIFIFIRRSDEGMIEPFDYLTLLFALFVIFMSIFGVIQYRRQAPLIVIDENFISFNGETYLLTDIKKVDFTGKQKFPFLFFNHPMEAATIYFHNNEKKIIYDDMYQNTWELKSCLKQVVKRKRFVAAVKDTGIAKPHHEFYETFTDSQFLSVRGLSNLALVTFFLYMLIVKRLQAKWWIPFIIFMIIPVLILHAWQTHYFQISSAYFVVRNQLLFWRKKHYSIDEIKEIVFETKAKMPNCLRVITNDFKSTLYPAGSLNNSTWRALEARLKQEGIKVRNEIL